MIEQKNYRSLLLIIIITSFFWSTQTEGWLPELYIVPFLKISKGNTGSDSQPYIQHTDSMHNHFLQITIAMSEPLLDCWDYQYAVPATKKYSGTNPQSTSTVFPLIFLNQFFQHV